MSQPHRHNRQDGQIQNLRNFQIFLRVVTGTVLTAALGAAAIYALKNGLGDLWRNVAPFLTCCITPVVCILAIGVFVTLSNRRSPTHEPVDLDDPLSDVEQSSAQ